jgi:hypothetical protein
MRQASLELLNCEICRLVASHGSFHFLNLYLIPECFGDWCPERSKGESVCSGHRFSAIEAAESFDQPGIETMFVTWITPFDCITSA